jgi:hypothetical protein
VWVAKTGVNLAVGQHVLRVVSEKEYFNLDRFGLRRENRKRRPVSTEAALCV